MINLSVIIPVYNVEEYIEECIQSIVNQTIKNMEIIIVNDGSTDDSISIVERFNDNRIKIINKKNGGLSSARNCGIMHAKGEYISFVDSDDYLCRLEALEEMYSIAKSHDSDIVVGNAIKCYSENRQNIFRRDKNIFKEGCMTSEDFLIKFRKSYSMHSAVWLNMYRTSLIKDNNLLFKEGYYHEDEDFTPKVFLKSNRISIYPKNFYIYRSREGSIINSKNVKRGYDLINICIGLQETLNNISSAKLKKIMAEDAAILLMKASYENRIKKLPKGSKLFVLKNTYNFKLKLHGMLYVINNQLYYKYLDKKC